MVTAARDQRVTRDGCPETQPSAQGVSAAFGTAGLGCQTGRVCAGDISLSGFVCCDSNPVCI